MIRVKATREGEIGGRTASGYAVDRVVPFVALPAVKALRRFVRVRNVLNGRAVIAIVLDVGPWNEKDDPYVFQRRTRTNDPSDETEIRPAAESGTDQFGRTTNAAGIDLGEAVWKALGMLDNGMVEWEFLE